MPTGLQAAFAGDGYKPLYTLNTTDTALQGANVYALPQTGGNLSWKMIEVLPQSDILSGTINISDIIKSLIWNGVVNPQDYVSGSGFGAEPLQGSGSVFVSNLSYQWNGNPTVTLSAGNNTYNVTAPGGNDIVGNGAADTVIYQGAHSQYQIKQSGTETLVQQSGNISTLDVLNGIAFVQFSDGTYNVATSTFASTGTTTTGTGTTTTGTGTTMPTISSLVESPASGDLNAGKAVTLTLNLSEAVTVAGGTPTLTLNDGGTATYSGGSGASSALTFSYAVAAGQNTGSLAATKVNLNGATVKDGAGNAANLSMTDLSQSGPHIDTTTPTVSSLVESPASGDLGAGKTVTLTLDMSEAVTVNTTGGAPTLSLNDGGTATYSGGSGSNALTFSYTVAAGQNTSGLAATAINLNSATITDGAGNAANLSLTGLAQGGPQIDTGTPTGAGTSTPSSGATPPTPTISSFSPDSGKASGGYTDAHALALTGTAEANSKIEVFDGSAQLGTANVNASRAWSYTTPTLSDGTQTFTAKDVGASGKVSTSSAGLTVTVVTAATVTQVGSNYNVTTTTSDPVLKYKGANVTASEFTGWTPIGAVQTASGYDVAWKNNGTGQYTVWTTDSSGDFTGSLMGAVSGTSAAWQSIAPIFSQTLNSGGGGVIGPTTKVVQKDGSTSLTEVANQFYLYGSSGSGPALRYNGANVTAGEFGTWTPIGAVRTASGYDVAWKNTGTGQYTVWSTDSNGNYKGKLTGGGAVSGASSALESLEPVFHQDLNRDGVIGLTRKVVQTTKVVQKDGSTSLTEVANQFYLYGSSGSGPALRYNGANVTAGEFGTWTPIGAVRTASGYDVAWKNTGTGQYTVWSTDSNGNYKGKLTGGGAVSGASSALESLEPVFHQDLNRDGVVGLTRKVVQTRKVIQTDGSTSLTEVANQFYLYGSSGSGPALRYNGANVRAGEFGTWTPIGAVRTASGYDVAWKNTGTGQYTVWSTDSNGNYKGKLTGGGVVSGTSSALESLEPVFHQDLNRDGVIGLTRKVVQTREVIQTDGSTSLTEVANQFYLYGSSGSGPALRYNGANVRAGEFGTWTPIGAVRTASGYDVAWKNTGTGQYTVWSTDSNGNYKGKLTGGVVSGTSSALESLEPVFHQDLNRDGVVGLYAAAGKALQISKALAGTSGSATIGTGATLELTAADSASVTFAGSTGTLRLDHSSTFSGKISKFTGNGSPSGSDHIDLRDVKYSSIKDSYANGVLTIADASGDTAKLNFNGSYTLANFKFTNDGGGGTIVYDPPVTPSSDQNTAAPGPVVPSATTGTRETVDPMDLPGMAFNVQATLGYLPNGNHTGGIPSPPEAIHNPNIALLGNYMASIFAMTGNNDGMMRVAEVAQPNDQSALSNPHHA